ncbi:hypothetical protein J3R83DRAFT_11306, partial [Lanmaoa asiatica]
CTFIERQPKELTSPVYTFFGPDPEICEFDSRCAKIFKCSGHGCKVKICRYLDTKDAHSTLNIHKHAQACWGDGAISAADKARDVAEVCKTIIKSILHDGSIMASFKYKGKGKPMYGFCCHTHAETR